MGIPANIHDAWAAGAGSPTKYEFRMTSTQDGDEADFVWHGTLSTTNYPYQSMNGFPASDFGSWSMGDDDFSRVNGGEFSGVYHYNAESPWTGIPGLGTDKILLQFQGRTWRGGGPNTTEVWTKDGGKVLTRSSAAGERSVSFSISFHLHLTRDPEQIVIFYNGSGADNGYNGDWFRHEPYIYVRHFLDAGLIEFDYRPGERKIQNIWESHNRNNGGVCERKNGDWYEMRTHDGDKDAKGDTPERKRSNQWYNQHKIGANAGNG